MPSLEGNSLSVGGLKLTSNKSSIITELNLASNMCSALGITNRFKYVKGVYQDTTVTDSNATLQENIRNNITHIDENGTIHIYKYDSGNSCIRPVVSGEINFEISGKNLVHTDTSITVDSIDRYQYYTSDKSGNKIAWLHTPDENVSIAYLEYQGELYASNDYMNNIVNENLFLVVTKSANYAEGNVTSSICP